VGFWNEYTTYVIYITYTALYNFQVKLREIIITMGAVKEFFHLYGDHPALPRADPAQAVPQGGRGGLPLRLQVAQHLPPGLQTVLRHQPRQEPGGGLVGEADGF
jgi:hypothetical protein